MFDPAIGRWISEDPIEFDAGDENLNRYVGNNPASKTDPSGLDYMFGLLGDWTVDSASSYLTSLAETWSTNGFQLGSHLLSHFLSPANNGQQHDISSYASSIYDNLIYKQEFFKYVARKARTLEFNKVYKLPDRVTQLSVDEGVREATSAFSAEHANIGLVPLFVPWDNESSGTDLTWAFGTGHYGYTNATLLTPAPVTQAFFSSTQAVHFS